LRSLWRELLRRPGGQVGAIIVFMYVSFTAAKRTQASHVVVYFQEEMCFGSKKKKKKKKP
jgi:hypothetical protein